MVTEAMVTNLIDKGRDQGYLLSDEVVAAFPNAEEHLDVLEEFYSHSSATSIVSGARSHPSVLRTERRMRKTWRLGSGTRFASISRRSVTQIS